MLKKAFLMPFRFFETFLVFFSKKVQKTFKSSSKKLKKLSSCLFLESCVDITLQIRSQSVKNQKLHVTQYLIDPTSCLANNPPNFPKSDLNKLRSNPLDVNQNFKIYFPLSEISPQKMFFT